MPWRVSRRRTKTPQTTSDHPPQAKKAKSERDVRHPVEAVQHAVHGVGDELGGPPLLQLALVHAHLAQHPADVAPEEAVLRACGGPRPAGRTSGVVDAVHGDPRDRPALARQHAGEGAEVLEGLRHAEAAVGQEAVVGQADPDRAREPPEGEGGAEPRPA